MLDNGDITALELAQEYLTAIEEKNGELNAYLEVFDDVLAQARSADAMIARGAAGPLTGIPVAVKDNILIKGRVSSGASKILEHYTATYDAAVIAALRAQGVVFLGRTNMDEFAMGGSTENSAFGPSKNPHDTARVPGGSSGGSAAAVGGNLALAALGTDTGGSIRQPASFCGSVGLKPTYGHVSRSGLMAMGSSLDQAGPITKTVGDAKIVFSAIDGYDAMDSTSLPEKARPSSTEQTKTIGVPRDLIAEGVDDDVREEFEKALTALERAGYTVRDVALPNAAYALATYYIIMPAEASTNLARYDGIRYGLHVDAKDIHDVFRKTRGAGFGPEVRRRILIGTFVLAAGYADAYYRKAAAVRELIRNDFTEALKDVDAIVTPTTPTPAFRIGEKSSDPLAMYAADIFTVPVNLAGVPALSVPSGSVVRDGSDLPVGFQIIGQHGDEEGLFTIGRAIEQAQVQ